MTLYEFTVRVNGDVFSAFDDLYEAGTDDALWSGEDGGPDGEADFGREAASAVDAMVSAILQIESCGLEVVQCDEDLIAVATIAERLDLTPQAVDHWIHGRRGPGGFPAPRVPRERVSLYSWSDVARWVADNGLAPLDAAALEVAEAAAKVNAALELRRQRRLMEPKERRQVEKLALAS